MGCEGAELSLLFTDDAEIAELNGTYRDKPKATDVLSFPQVERSGKHPSGHFAAAQHLGDVVISVPTAARQARLHKVALRRELLRLLIHGVLHLVGYDHEKVPQREARKMRAKEEELYAALAPEL